MFNILIICIPENKKGSVECLNIVFVGIKKFKNFKNGEVILYIWK